MILVMKSLYHTPSHTIFSFAYCVLNLYTGLSLHLNYSIFYTVIFISKLQSLIVKNRVTTNFIRNIHYKKVMKKVKVILRSPVTQ